MNTRNHLLELALAAALAILVISIACSATGLSPAFSTQVAQTVQAQLDATQAGDTIATMVAATIIASGGTPPPPATEPPPAVETPTPGPDDTPAPAETPVAFQPEAPEVDFNGDGFTDLVVGIPGLADGDDGSVGGFYIFMGGPEGILSGEMRLMPAREVLPFTHAQGNFGNIIEVGDFDGDGFSDLALSYLYGNADDTGMLALLYGSREGITTSRLELWDQDQHLKEGEGVSPGTLEDKERGDLFGASLVAADFNGDGFDDLAIGTPRESHETIEDAGAVSVLYGSETGLTHIGNALIHQNGFFVEQDGQALQIGDLIGGAERGDLFGASLAAGDINGDSFDDLVIGAYEEAIGPITVAGVVNVVYGSAGGLTPAGNQHPHKGGFYTDVEGDGEVNSNIEGGLQGDPEEFAGFGFAVAVADFNGDGYGDLAVGAPGHSADGQGAAGLVHFVFGSPEGLTIENSQVWNQQSGTRLDGTALPGLLSGGKPENQDQFGTTLQAADFNGDGYADLAVGSVGEDFEDLSNSGAVSVLYGSAQGMEGEGSQWYSLFETILDSSGTGPGLVGGPQASAGFGSSFTADDYNADGLPDLVAGAPYLRVHDASRAGGFYILFSNPETGLSIDGHQQWTTPGAQNAQGVPIGNFDGSPGEEELFGLGLR